MIELIDKIRKDIEETGFISEMKAAKCFLDKNWSVNIAQTYHDLDSGIAREYDILAGIHEITEVGCDNPIHTSLELCIEVKKTKYSWVILKNPPSERVGLR